MIGRLLDLLGGWKLKLAAVGLALAAFGAALLRAYLAGRASVRAAADKARLKAMRKRKEIDDEVAAMDRSDLDERWNSYLRDGE
jgi:hypothetical protein